jgi:predicted HTH transcriptional regulator
MLFALDLIESYGSGIRRAKNAMKANGSPELVFEPDNDIDDYTMVTAYINEEFKKIQQEEQGLGSGKVSDKTSQMSDKMSDKQLIIYSCAEKFIENQGYVTTMDISKETGIPLSTVRRYMASLCENKLLKSEGEKKKTIYRKLLSL